MSSQSISFIPNDTLRDKLHIEFIAFAYVTISVVKMTTNSCVNSNKATTYKSMEI